MQVVASQSTAQATVQGCDAISKSKLALSMGKQSARARKSAGSNIDAKLMPGWHVNWSFTANADPAPVR